MKRSDCLHEFWGKSCTFWFKKEVLMIWAPNANARISVAEKNLMDGSPEMRKIMRPQ